MPHPGGRPTVYSPELGRHIYSLLCNTDMTIQKICEQVGIDRSTFYDWAIMEDRLIPEFADMYARAMQKRMYSTGDDMIGLADENVIEGDRSDNARVKQKDTRLKTRQWILSKRLAHLYGDKLTIDANVEFALPDIRPAIQATAVPVLDATPELGNGEAVVPVQDKKP